MKLVKEKKEIKKKKKSPRTKDDKQQIQRAYLQESAQQQIKEVLEKEMIVQLQEFFTQQYANELLEDIKKVKKKKASHTLQYQYEYALANKNEDSLQSCKEFIEKIIKQKIKKIEIIFAQKGNYTVLTDEQKSETGYDAILDLTKIWAEEWGGLLYYRYGDEEKKQIPCLFNSLVIIKKKSTRKYLKYINHHASVKRILIIFS